MQRSNTFSQRSEAYASDRPLYPDALYAWIASQCAHTRVAWDCATGNGQAAVGLAACFDEVHATDISVEQIAHALPHPAVTYSARSAEQSGFADASFDLVTVAQGLHWFDFARFWPEVTRVCRPGGLFCAWGYSWLTINPELDAVLMDRVRGILEPLWAPNNAILWRGYQEDEIAFPYTSLPTPELAIEVTWTLEQLLRYLHTWSAYKISAADPWATAELEDAERAAQQLVAPEERLTVRMPLVIRAAHVHPAKRG